VWGGLVEKERRSVRRRRLAETSVTEILRRDAGGDRSGPVQPGKLAYQDQSDR
jgi:hypothetical protein